MERTVHSTSNNLSTVACVFIAVVTFLTSRALATVNDIYTDTQTDGRVLSSTPLRWAQVSWYTHQLLHISFKHSNGRIPFIHHSSSELQCLLYLSVKYRGKSIGSCLLGREPCILAAKWHFDSNDEDGICLRNVRDCVTIQNITIRKITVVKTAKLVDTKLIPWLKRNVIII
jgi:hypothetical protein